MFTLSALFVLALETGGLKRAPVLVAESEMTTISRRLKKGLSHTYYGFNPNDEGELNLVGLANGTSYQITDVGTGQIFFGGTLNRGEKRDLLLEGHRHIKVTADSRIQVLLGKKGTGYGGSMVFPAEDGAVRVGNNFSFSLPILRNGGDFVIFAYEGSNVVIRNASNSIVANFSLPSGGYWKTSGAPLQEGSFYTVQSSGKACIQWIAPSGNLAIPSATGSETGRRFLFGTNNGYNDDGGALAVFAYEDALVTITNLDNGQPLAENVAVQAGRSYYRNLVPTGRWKLESTGNVSVWSGGTQGGDEIGEMGDDITQNFGSRGQVFHLNSQNAATLITSQDSTSIRVEYYDGNYNLVDVAETSLNADAKFDLQDSHFVRIQTSKPVTVFTVGGALFPGLDDWGKILTEISSADDNDPETSILTGPVEASANRSPIVFTWTGFDLGTPTPALQYAWRIDSGSWSNYSSVTTTTFSNLSEGSHRFEVRSRDLDGRVDQTPAFRNFVVDNVAPVISNIQDNGRYYDATISWITNEASDTFVEYGTTPSYGLTASNVSMVLSHSIVLQNLTPNQQYFYRVGSKDAAGNQSWSAQRVFVTQQLADLEVTGGSAPAEVWTDRAFELNWSLTNRGPGQARGPWVDSIALSTDPLPGGDIALASYGFSGTINANSSVERAQPVTVPRSAITNAGTYYLIVTADTGNSVLEGQEDDNWRAIPINVQVTPLPDLIVEEITAPATAYAGQTIEVQFRVKNVGGAPTDAAAWLDSLYLSSDEVPGLEDPVRLSVGNVSALGLTAESNSYTSSAFITLPVNLVGQYRLIVWTDGTGGNAGPGVRVAESNEVNNWLTNRVIQVQVPPHPDFQVTQVLAQDEVFAGNTIRVRWTVNNRGTSQNRADQTSWTDAVYLSRDTNIDPQDRFLGTWPHSGTLAQGEGYTEERLFNLPSDIVGNWYAIVETDSGRAVSEFGAEGNNTSFDPTAVLVRATPPDLVVTTVQAVSSGRAGTPIEVTYQVKNQGAYPAHGPWSDSIYLSDDPIYSPTTDKHLGTFQGLPNGEQLNAGASYSSSRTVSVTLPDCDAGLRYLIVVADRLNTVFEYDSGYDAEANNAKDKQVTLNLTPPDLQVVGINAPAVVQAGQLFTVAWTVRNSGQGSTITNGWVDEVYITPTSSFVGATRLTAVGQGATLAPNATYQGRATIPAPRDFNGTYYLWVRTDSGDSVEECEQDGNNLSAPRQIGVSNQQPDLRPTLISTPTTLLLGDAATATITIENNGFGLSALGWYDRLYLATSDNEQGRPLQSRISYGPIQAGGPYQVTFNYDVPVVEPGSYLLVASTDSDNHVAESNEGNNRLLQSVTLAPPNVDLVPANLNGPADAESGAPIQVSWNVTNSGAAQTLATNWIDRVYLSRDQVLDATDESIGYFTRNAALGSGANYAANLSVTPRQGLTGRYYLFVVSDAGNVVGELSESNNLLGPRPIDLRLMQPVDLVPESVQVSGALVAGEDFGITYTVRNASGRSLTRAWRDTLYLSSDNVLDGTDVVILRKEQDRTVGSNATYAETLTGIVPPVKPGNYFVFVKADAANVLLESNETNNALGSSSQSVTYHQIPLTGQANWMQPQGRARYFESAAATDETLRYRISSPGTGSLHELLASKGSPASRLGFQFASGFGTTGPQTLLVPPDSEAKKVYTAASRSAGPISDSTTLESRVMGFEIEDVQPRRIGNDGQVTLRITGGQLHRAIAVELQRGETVLQAVKTEMRRGVLRARFVLSQQSFGDYRVTVRSATGEASGEALVEVEATVADQVFAHDVGPNRFRRGSNIAGTIIVSNLGNVDAELADCGVDFVSASGRVVLNMPEHAIQLEDPNSADLSGPNSFFLKDLSPGDDVSFSYTLVGHGTEADIPGRAFAIPIKRSHLLGFLPGDGNRWREFVVNNGGGALAPEVLAALSDQERVGADLERILRATGLVEDGDFGDRSDAGGVRNAACIALCSIGPTFLCVLDCELFLVRRIGFCGRHILRPDWSVTCMYYAILKVIQCTVRCQRELECCIKNCNGEGYDGPPCFARTWECWITRLMKCLVEAFDPNEKDSPDGFGPDRMVSSEFPISYVVSVENVGTATAAANTIRINDTISPHLDVRTLKIRSLTLANQTWTFDQPGAYINQRFLIERQNRQLAVDCIAGVDLATRRLFVNLTSIDPVTGEAPTDPLLGILEPEDGTGRGQGEIRYDVRVADYVTTGTDITNQASIIFDANPAIETNIVSNRIDRDAPVATLFALSEVSPETLTLRWTASDGEHQSGVRDVEIWTRNPGGTFELVGTYKAEDGQATFSGIVGLQYEFLAIAVDNVGNREPFVPSAEASTLVGDSFLVNGLSPTSAVAGSGNLVLTVTGVGFNDQTNILWNNYELATEYLSPTQVRCTVPAAYLARPGVAKVSANRVISLIGSEVLQQANNVIFTIRRP